MFGSGVVIQILGLVLIVTSMILFKLPLLLDQGPRGWVQFLAAMLGYLLLLSGLFLDQWIKSEEDKINVWRRALITLLVGGGPYLFMLAFVTTTFGSKLDYALVIGGTGCLTLGMIVRYVPAVGKFLETKWFETSLVKGGLILWMGIIMAVFLLYWGAPLEFWSFVERLGLGGFLHGVQDSLSHFFGYY